MRRHFWSCSLHQNVHDAVELDSVILPTIKQTKLDIFNFTYNTYTNKIRIRMKRFFFIKIKGCLFNWPSPVFNAKRKTNRQPNMLVHEISLHNYAFGKMQSFSFLVLKSARNVKMGSGQENLFFSSCVFLESTRCG